MLGADRMPTPHFVVALLPIFALNSRSLQHRKNHQMVVTNEQKETTRVTASVTSTTLGVNVFTVTVKAMVGERPKPFGEPLGFDPATSTLIFGEYDAVLVDAMGTVAEAEALASWIALHNRNLETIYITHAHFDHFYGLGVLFDRFPARCPPGWFRPSPTSPRPSRSKATSCGSSSRGAPTAPTRPRSTCRRS